jgi:hypothetical protein
MAMDPSTVAQQLSLLVYVMPLATIAARSPQPPGNVQFKSLTSFQPGFYVCLAAIPTGLVLYKITRPGPDGQPYFSRLIADKYASYKTLFLERADVHTQAMERAAADRTLFMNESSHDTPRYIDLRYPE